MKTTVKGILGLVLVSAIITIGIAIGVIIHKTNLITEVKVIFDMVILVFFIIAYAKVGIHKEEKKEENYEYSKVVNLLVSIKKDVAALKGIINTNR